MMIMFGPLDGQGEKRSALHHAARLEMLHKRVVKHMHRTDEAADQVESAAEVLAEAVRPAGSTQTLGM